MYVRRLVPALIVIFLSCFCACAKQPEGTTSGTHTTTDRVNLDGASSAGTTTSTRYISYAQVYKRFSTVEAYCDFLESADEATLRTVFSKKEYDGTMYFHEETFENVLKDREYLVPVIPEGYTLEHICLATLESPKVVLKKGDHTYTVHFAPSKSRKIEGMKTDESFVREDGTPVRVDYFPDNGSLAGGGVCLWDAHGYECDMEYTKEEKETVFELIRKLEFQLVKIKE